MLSALKPIAVFSVFAGFAAGTDKLCCDAKSVKLPAKEKGVPQKNHFQGNGVETIGTGGLIEASGNCALRHSASNFSSP
jgi:hypothetical protein